ncbi:MAG: hypothetical protein WD295_04320 [Bacteroidota bacterium]
MAKVILQISYEIQPEKRGEYLALVGEMKSHFTDVRKKEYQVFEVKGKKNSFVEQFVSGSIEEFEGLEDDLDERSEELVNRLETFLRDGTSRYTTLVEL